MGSGDGQYHLLFKWLLKYISPVHKTQPIGVLAESLRGQSLGDLLWTLNPKSGDLGY